MSTSAGSSSDTSFFGHPRGLAVLFFAEMWERFSYYGMRALLVTYLIVHFIRTESDAYGIYAAYAGMIYLAPVLGGYLADRYLGSRKAVAYGAMLITLGHFCMAYEGNGSEQHLETPDGNYALEQVKNPEGNNPQFVEEIEIDGQRFRVDSIVAAEAGTRIKDGTTVTVTYFTDAERTEKTTIAGSLSQALDMTAENAMFLALALIIVGTGFLKANISAVVGALYELHDTRRDGGFTLFYLGINLGSFIGQLSVAYLGITYGWSYGFGLAGIGMLLGLIIFLRWAHWLDGRGEPPHPEELRASVFAGLNREWIIYLSGIAMVAVSWLVVKYLGQYNASDLLGMAGIVINSASVINDFTLFDLVVNMVFAACFIGVLIYSLIGLDHETRDRMVVLLVLTLSSVIFWTLFDQAPTSLILFQSKFVDTGVFNAQQIGSLNPLFIIFLAPLFSAAWTRLGRAGREPASPFKFAMGLAQIGLGFLVLYLGIKLTAGEDLIVPLYWVVLMYLLHTTGELFLSPVGLSAVTKLSAPRLVGFMMGIWFMAISLAQVMAALVSKVTVVPADTPAELALTQYALVYFWLGVASILVGVLLAIAGPKLKSMMHGRM